MEEKFCPRCEIKVKRDDLFCRKCGAKLIVRNKEKGPKRKCGHYYKGVICPVCGRLSLPSKK